MSNKIWKEGKANKIHKDYKLDRDTGKVEQNK